MAFQPLGDLLKKNLTERPGLGAQIQASVIVDRAQAVLAELHPVLASRVRVVWYKDHTLGVQAVSGAAASELRLREAQYLHLLRQRLPQNAARRLQYLPSGRTLEP